MSGFGKGQIGGSAKKNFYKIKEGSQVYRILPPWASMRSNPKGWAVYYSTHWGYKDTNGKHRPFQSPEVFNFNTKMVEVSDAAKNKIKDLEGKREQAKIEKNDGLVKHLSEALKQFNLENKWYMNVVDLQGNIGVLSIPHKMKLALEAEFKVLQQEGKDPFSLSDGRYFVFSRSGMGPSTIHKVSVYEEVVNLNGTMAKIPKVHTITQDLISRMEFEGSDLGSLYPRPTSEEVAAMVQAGGTPAAVEGILNKYRTKNSSEESLQGPDEEVAPPQEAVAPATTQPSAPLAQPLVTNSQPAPALVQQPTTGFGAGAPAKTTAPATVDNMSNEDFLKSLGY